MCAQDKKPKLYVALGASAGGLEALESFFSKTPDDTGFAFIVIQHLSPDHKSLMVELLAKVTRMEVLRASDALEVERNKVYLIPPKKNLTIFHGKLMLSDQKPNRGINFPIDIFLRSLAEDQEDRGVAIILSGTGSDGSQGIRAIKDSGGIVMVQSEDSAKFDGMPRAALATGLVDFTLPPGEMPKKLTSVFSHWDERHSIEPEELVSDETDMTKVFSLLRDQHKIDFTFYKPNTVQRRIQRRMNVNQIDTLKEYVHFLKANTIEVTTLYRELLIGVTRFFRNKEVYNQLAEEILPEILNRRTESEIRFWVAGCSTGEEAYTLAILVREALEDLKINRDVKIFATDLDRDAVAFAQNGVYSESIAADVDTHLLSKYFFRKDDSFRVSRAIREMVVFAQHNLIKDPPFTNIELISCRNLLIYLQPVLQKKVLEMFTFSLNHDGYLVLGTSETVGELSDYFDQSYHKNRIFQIKEKYQHQSVVFPSNTRTSSRYQRKAGTNKGVSGFGRMGDEIKFIERFMSALVEQFTSVALVVDPNMDVLHVVGDTQGLFLLPPGRMTSDISRLAIKDLSLPLTTGLQKVFRTKEDVKYNGVPVKRDGRQHKYDVVIRLLPASNKQDPLCLVLLEDITDRISSSTQDNNGEPQYSLSKGAEQHIADLEQELQFTKENLQATIEELETSNEELQATNEELLASNEELQSTNEELQSTNEELHTINAQYQSKIIELTELNNDVENLLNSSHIGKIILDDNLEIRRFSRHVLNIFKILEDDIGRPLTHISHYIKNLEPTEIAELVVKNEQTIEQEVETRDGHWYLMRALPYRIGPEVYSGVVMTFVNIDQIKQAQMDLVESEENLRYTAQLTQIANWSYEFDTQEFQLSPEGRNLFSVDADKEIKLEDVLQVFVPSDRIFLENIINNRAEDGEFDFIANTVFNDKPLILRVIGSPLKDKNKTVRITGAVQDITSVLAQEEEQKSVYARYKHVFENTNQGVVYQDKSGMITDANPAACRILGLNRDELIGRESRDPRWKAVRPDGSELSSVEHPSMRALASGTPVTDEIMGIHNPQTDSTHWISVQSFPFFSDGSEEKPEAVYTIFSEVSEELIKKDE